MTDLAMPALRNVDVASNAAQRRIRSRYRAEARFRFYGLLAIVATATFLGVVLSDILIRGVPAFFQHRLVIPVAVNSSIIPEGRRDAEALRTADWQSLVRDALRARFPDVSERRSRRLLEGLLSDGASDPLRNKVISDPTLVGRDVTAEIILSDEADLYFKGVGTAIERQPGRGEATPVVAAESVTISSSANDFGDHLVMLRRAFADRARVLHAEASRLDREAQHAMRAGRSSDNEALATRAQEKKAEGDLLQARFEGRESAETLDASTPSLLIAINGGLVKVEKLSASTVQGTTLLPLKSANPSAPGSWRLVRYTTPESDRRISDREVTWLEQLRDEGMVQRVFNWSFFTSGDSREPELAGIRGALIGSALTLLVTLALCLPIGVAAAIYLEEFAPRTRLTELIEVNINNLAAVPSIVFGLLGLAVFLNAFNLPRSAPLVGGLVLALLVLPTIIIAARAA